MSKQSGVSNIIYGLLVIAILSAAIFGLTRLESTFDTELSDIKTEVASISTSISSDPAISVGAAAEALVTTSPLCKIEVTSLAAYSLTDTACNEDQLIASLFDGDGRAVEDQKSFSTSFEDGLCEDSYSNNNYVEIDIRDIAIDELNSWGPTFSSVSGYFSQYYSEEKQYYGMFDNYKLAFLKREYLNYNVDFCDYSYAITFGFSYYPPGEPGMDGMDIPNSYTYTCGADSYVTALVGEENLGKKLCIVW